MNAVFNTSPIIFLAKLGYLEFAFNLFDEIWIPQGVHQEITQKHDRESWEL